MGDETGSWFEVPGEDRLPDDLRGLFAKARERIGFVPNVLRVWSFRPERLRPWFSHFRSLHEPTPGLGAAERELVAVVVSQTNGCLYCLVAHGAALREALGDPVRGDRATLDWRRADLDERQTAVAAYAEKLTRSPREVGDADLAALRAVGLTDEEVWDVVELTAMYNLTNRVAMATGMLPNPEYHAQAR